MVKVKVKYPPTVSPVCLVGARVRGKPNFMAIAWWTFLEARTMLVGVISEKPHYTNKGIHEHNCFSINIPSAEIVEKTDYCGIYSGNSVDKSSVFEVFYGELKEAPMISECPVTMECRLVRTVGFEYNEMLVGEIVGVYVDESCMTGDKGDMKKVNPLLYDGGLPATYWKIGEQIAKAYDVGKAFKPKD
jgi:flavin reductase (DIM6/NTAB) family NADH-FMN oxidoreductase RutF